ncbi:hypothetical protein R1sor_004143 [Riccia sorocarpa]|uniref:Globin domain-containing protein n=1 Tax=Riccia sorocarpa TaxID=122646 RepID=A0ABD3H5I3_9MARC
MASMSLSRTLVTGATWCTTASLDCLRTSWSANQTTPKMSPGRSFRRSPAIGTAPVKSSSSKQDTRSLRSSWTQSGVFGGSELTQRFASSFRRDTSRQPCKAVAAYTSEQAQLVKTTWQLLKKDAGKNGMTLFLKVFEIAPSAAELFSFLRDSPIPREKNPQLKAHALTVFKMVGDAAVELGEHGGLEALKGTLVELGVSHYSYGILNEHFDVVKYALLQTIQEGLPELWSPELKAAWAQAYDELTAVIKEVMKGQKAQKAEAQAASA